MRSGNPALGDQTFRALPYAAEQEAMTIRGTVNKTGLLLLCVILTAGWTWHRFFQTSDPSSVVVWVTIGAFGGLILALITVFKQTWAPVTAPIYSLLEGLFIGGVSSIAESQYPGIVIQAVGLTFGTLVALLAVYSSGLIKATENFKLGVAAATGGIFLVYLVSLVLGLFGIR